MEEQKRHQERWFNYVTDAMLCYSSAFCMSVMEGREGERKRQHSSLHGRDQKEGLYGPLRALGQY